MRTVNIYSGLPGSGKSEYSIHKSPRYALGLYRDVIREDVRRLYDSETVPERTEYYHWIKLINKTLAEQPQREINIVQETPTLEDYAKLLDNIDLNPQSDTLVIHIFKTPLETCLIRNSKREGRGRLPDQTIINMHKSSLSDPITLIAAKKLYLNTTIQEHHFREGGN